MTRAPNLKVRALRYLSVRDYSRKELAGKLLRFVQDGDDIDALLVWLEKRGFLSDARFAESLIRRRAARYGNSRIRHELRNHQVDGTLSDSVMAELMQNETARAREVRARKFGALPTDAKEHGRQARFLQQRGFSPDAVRKALSAPKD